MKVAIWLLDRLMPTMLMGSSAALLTVGVLSYAPSAFGEWQTPAPTVGGDPLFESPSPGPPTAWPSVDQNGSGDLPSALPSAPPATLVPGETPSPLASDLPIELPTSTPRGRPPTASPTQGPTARPTNGPIGTPGSTPRPSHVPPLGPGEHATRIRIPSLEIDLPVVPSNLVVPGDDGFYPLCDVAMYMVGFVDPGEPGSTYIYGHAQDGMFAPLLHASKYNDGASMIGALVQVYTDDNLLHLYQITLVKRHSIDLSVTRVPPGVHQLVLQTSEGWSGHLQKLQIAAQPVAVVAASYAAAHPTPHPRVCLPN